SEDQHDHEKKKEPHVNFLPYRDDMCPERAAQKRLVPCVGAIARDDEGRLLVIRRAHSPGAGLWSIPGGRIDPGETPEQALVREVQEETGLEVSVGRLLGTVERDAGESVYAIADYECEFVSGTLRAGTDADDA